MKFAPKKARLTMQDKNVDIHVGPMFRNVRRRLFQDDDENGESTLHPGIEDNVTNCFFEEVRKNRENAKERWNFDFEKEEPLPGRYEWVKIDKDGNEVPQSEKLNNARENTKQAQEENMLIDVKENGEIRTESDGFTST